METVICDISAFEFWRIPPVVRLLTGAPADDADLQRHFSRSEIERLRFDMLQELSLCKACLSDGTKWRRSGQVSQAVRDACLLLASGMSAPVDVLVGSAKDAHASTVVRFHAWGGALQVVTSMHLTDELAVTSPAFTLQQLAGRSSLIKTVMLASELCGSFAVYRAPAPIRRFLQRRLEAGGLPRYGGWSPCTTPDGKLSELWIREPLVTPAELAAFAERSESSRGRKRLLRAAELVCPEAASPFEVQMGMLLGLPKRLGGEGLGGFEHNKRIPLSGKARLLANRDCCYGDLVWGEELDLECQGLAFHNNQRSYLSDSERMTALELMGYQVLPVTHEQIRSPDRFDALCEIVAQSLGKPRKQKTASQMVATRDLRSQLFVDWHDLVFD